MIKLLICCYTCGNTPHCTVQQKYTNTIIFFIHSFKNNQTKAIVLPNKFPGPILSVNLQVFPPEGGITGRGCSTKDKVYYKECETNTYGEGTEKFCYCNFYLCNGAVRIPSGGFTLAFLSAW